MIRKGLHHTRAEGRNFVDNFLTRAKFETDSIIYRRIKEVYQIALSTSVFQAEAWLEHYPSLKRNIAVLTYNQSAIKVSYLVGTSSGPSDTVPFLLWVHHHKNLEGDWQADGINYVFLSLYISFRITLSKQFRYAGV